MNYQDRRDEIIRMLSENGEFINATQFANHFGVTRQVIVSDVALLRANGHPIQAGRRGYRLEPFSDSSLLRTISCKHSGDQVLDEFYTIVDNGGRVMSVIVEHPIYGQISADLSIDSRYDAREFVERQRSSNASQLSDLTDGVHLHMLRVPNEDAYQRIIRELSELGILCSSEE